MPTPPVTSSPSALQSATEKSCESLTMSERAVRASVPAMLSVTESRLFFTSSSVIALIEVWPALSAAATAAPCSEMITLPKSSSADSEADELHAGSVLLVPVGLPVVVRKVGRQAPEILDAQFAGRGVDDELEGLPDVLHRRAALDDDVAGFVTFDHEIFDRLMF